MRVEIAEMADGFGAKRDGAKMQARNGRFFEKIFYCVPVCTSVNRVCTAQSEAAVAP